LDRAIQLYERALERLKRIGKNAPARLVFDTKAGLATILTNLKRKLPEARMLFEEAVDLAGREATIPKTKLAATLAYFAWIPMYAGNSREAEALWLKGLVRRRRHGFGAALATGRQEDPGGFWEADALYGLMSLHGEGGDYAAAQEFARQGFVLHVQARLPANCFGRDTWL
jgi:tetratricopeptide (TPR) repeat protein